PASTSQTRHNPTYLGPRSKEVDDMDAPTRLAGRARRFSPILTAILLLSLFLAAACTGGDDGDDDSASDAMPVAQATTAGGSAMLMPASSGESAGAAATPAGDSAGDARQPAQGWQQRIIRTANVTLAVVDGEGGVGSALESVRVMATTKGGFVFSSNSYVEQDRQFAQITIQVPVEQFDSTMNDLRNAPFVDEVVREESSSQDVSEEFVDNESRLNALRETERRFLALLSEAETVEDILRLEHELTELRAQIETIQGRQNYLEQVTAFSTISVALQPSGESIEPQVAGGDDGFSLTNIGERAWDHSRGAIEAILIVTITLAIVGAAVLPVAAIGWFVVRIYRTRFRDATS
ncbi:MAG TPA: DUF4349 domain-containing protein, partial [Thermomicrobiales bacterium]|nr:DUF4349 domain-containing protein [Thermomicrobiales bacterium]